MYDEINEISYIKKYNNIIDKYVSFFVNLDIVEKEFEREFNEKMLNVKEGDRFREARIYSLQTKRKEDLEAVQRLREQENKSHKRRSVKTMKLESLMQIMTSKLKL